MVSPRSIAGDVGSGPTSLYRWRRRCDPTSLYRWRRRYRSHLALSLATSEPVPPRSITGDVGSGPTLLYRWRRRNRSHLALSLATSVAVPPRSLLSLVHRRVATLVELDATSVDAPLEGLHDVSAPRRIGPSAREQHLAVVRSVRVAHRDTRGIEAGVTVEAFVSSQLAQHTARPVSAWHVCNRLKLY